MFVLLSKFGLYIIGQILFSKVLSLRSVVLVVVLAVVHALQLQVTVAFIIE